MYNEAHAFVVEEAVKYGIDKALLLQHIRFWCNQNKGKESHTHENRTWMYQSAADMCQHYPYWSRQKISRLLRDMESSGLIISANYNTIGYDQTKWYALSNTLQCSNLNNRMSNIEQPIPDTKTDTKPDTLFDECWAMYHRKGNKQTSIRYWNTLSKEDKLSIQASIIPYINSRDSMQYCLDFQGYINPRNRRWEDEIIEKNENKRMSI